MHIRGIILEGYSNSGKTSILKSMKAMQAQDESAERSIIVLGEHYSQVQNKVNGEIVSLHRLEHLKILQERVEMLKKLNDWAIGLGPSKRQSRGLFFVLERFHLNHRVAFSHGLGSEIEELEQNLMDIGAICVLLTISNDIVKERLLSRDSNWNRKSDSEQINACREFIDTQEKLREQSRLSKVPTLEINTDLKEWDKYAEEIFIHLDSRVDMEKI